jgi:hypothetical protein
LSIISSAALAGSSERMNRFIFFLNFGNSGNTCNAYSIGFIGLNSFQFSIEVFLSIKLK